MRPPYLWWCENDEYPPGESRGNHVGNPYDVITGILYNDVIGIPHVIPMTSQSWLKREFSAGEVQGKHKDELLL